MKDSALSEQSNVNDDGAVAALLAVTGVDGALTPGRGRLHDLLRAITQAVGAKAGAVQVVDDRTGRFALAAAVNLQGVEELHNATLLDGLAGRVLEEDGAVRVEDGSPTGLLPGAAESVGLRHALGLPIHGRHRVIGAVWVAGQQPLTTDGVRGHAARVGAERLGWALEESRLYEVLERALGQILEADERMFARIGLDIHDGPTQLISVALLDVQLLEKELEQAVVGGTELPVQLRPSLARIYETLGGAVHEMRELIGQLRPAQFENRLLPDILGDAVGAFENRTGGRVEYRATGDFPGEGISRSQRITLYRTLQEALTNASRHGKATLVTVDLVGSAHATRLEVSDNGHGFEVSDVEARPAGSPEARFGIFGMRDRAELLGGTCEIMSEPGKGTRIVIVLPRWRSTASDLAFD